jgi:E1A/CREB-binding protein
MYVQEYGQDCPAPNKNVVYLSYLDSVKYFRPDNVLAHGCPNPKTSLRTFVYHQLLVGYLSYVKRLGYEQMYIWACPPMAVRHRLLKEGFRLVKTTNLQGSTVFTVCSFEQCLSTFFDASCVVFYVQGDDYIMYCHPSTQKTPRSDRLRAWYHDMLKDAQNKGYVTYLSTLWDTFFEGGRDHRLDLKDITAKDIPYLEGDYWPGELRMKERLYETTSAIPFMA